MAFSLTKPASRATGISASRAIVDQDTAVLIGDMNLLRCFSESHIPTYIVSRTPKDVLRFSKYYHGGCTVADPDPDPERFVASLVEVGKRFKRKPVLYFCDDSVLLAISRRRDVLEPYFLFILPPSEMVEDLVNKTKFGRLADKLHLPVPRTLVAMDIGTVDDIVRDIGLPCIFKPDSRHYGWYDLPMIREEGRLPQKVLRANTPEEAAHLLTCMRKQVGQFVVQPFLGGGADHVYSFHAYYNRQAKPLVSFVGRKLRTSPKESGTSTCLELIKDPEVDSLGREVLDKLHYVGPVKVDFMRDAVTERLYLLEVNVRHTLWNYLGAVSGINIPLAAWADLHGRPYAAPADYRTDVKWFALSSDITAFVREYRKENLTWRQWLCSYRGRKVYHMFAWHDPVPFLAQLLHRVRQYMRMP
jgi:D-aspartate ligase